MFHFHYRIVPDPMDGYVVIKETYTCAQDANENVIFKHTPEKSVLDAKGLVRLLKSLTGLPMSFPGNSFEITQDSSALGSDSSYWGLIREFQQQEKSLDQMHRGQDLIEFLS